MLDLITGEDLLPNALISQTMAMSAEEILAGRTQAGVPRPRFLAEHQDDGSVQRAVSRGVDAHE